MAFNLFRLGAATAVATVCASPLLAGCTHRAALGPSPAIAEARAARHGAPVDACAMVAGGPILVGFGFGESALTDYQEPYLSQILQWTSCHPATPVVISGASDGHGTPAEQQALANDRSRSVAAYLKGHGVANPLVTLGAGATEPGGEHLLVQAWGRRW